MRFWARVDDFAARTSVVSLASRERSPDPVQVAVNFYSISARMMFWRPPKLCQYFHFCLYFQLDVPAVGMPLLKF
jgi:hypothetical protein